MDPEVVGTDAEITAHASEVADAQKTVDAEKTWSQWRNKRNEVLASKHGWLSLTSLTQIPAAAGPVEGFPGTRRAVDGGGVYAAFATVDDVTQNGVPVEGEVVFQLDDEDSGTPLKHGTKVAEVAKRGRRYAIQIRDSLTPMRQRFKGVLVYGYDPSIVMKGMFESSDGPWDIPITVASPAVSGVIHIVGIAEPVYAGALAKLVVQGDPSTLMVVFYDGMSGMGTVG